MPNTVTDILRSSYLWPIDCAPAPKQTAKALETNKLDRYTAADGPVTAAATNYAAQACGVN